jgi:DNA-binding NtrC family response regulator
MVTGQPLTCTDNACSPIISDCIRSAAPNSSRAVSPKPFLSLARPTGPSCLVLEVRLPGASGLDVQCEPHQSDDRHSDGFVSGHGDLPMTVRAMKYERMDITGLTGVIEAQRQALFALDEADRSLSAAQSSFW